MSLSEYVAAGDWRLWFVLRDAMEKVELDDVNRVAKAYLIPSNRTLARFIPTDDAVRAIARYIRDSDELQRRIELEAVSTSTALVALLYLTAGLLQMAKVIELPAGPAMFWVFPLVCLGYGVAKGIIAWRYR